MADTRVITVEDLQELGLAIGQFTFRSHKIDSCSLKVQNWQ